MSTQVLNPLIVCNSELSVFAEHLGGGKEPERNIL
jgi:hypothetical protein